MPKRTTAIAVTALLLFALTGCGEDSTPAAEPKSFAAPLNKQADETPATEEPTVEPAIGYGPTAPGEVCDTQNLNDPICAAFYPDQLVLNLMTMPRAREPLSSMTDEQKITLAQQACADLGAGARPHVIETNPLADDHATSADRNNDLVYTAASLAYCNEHLTGKSAAYIAYYQALGEEGAKSDFADRVMPEV